MLCELRVKNLALIESLSLNFEESGGQGLLVMTGETGAGKSIMLRAITLLTGRRASADWVRTGAKSCEVEALFELAPGHDALLTRLEESGFGNERTVIIKRILQANGRSRLYINGSLATARLVTELTTELINVASQHDHQQLLQPPFHLDFIDTLGDLWPTRAKFQKMFSEMQDKLSQLNKLKEQEQDKEQRQDFLNFQVNEIKQAAPEIGEDEMLVTEKKRLKSAGTLIKVSQDSYRLLSGTIVDAMDTLRRNMEQLVEFDPQLEKLAEDIGSYSYLADDYANEIRIYRDSLEDNPYKLDQVNERLDILMGLKRKYGTTLEKVLEFLQISEKELAEIHSVDQRIELLEQELIDIEKRCLSAGEKLSLSRVKIGKKIEKKMAIELSSLSFNQAQLEVKWESFARNSESLRSSGFDRCEFFFAANPGEPAKPLAKVASGGELSRLMLAFKCLLAKKDMVDTVIFDEVDSGIGGEAAEAVARKIQELASHHQVFCITHLPQIAARGELHYQVTKRQEENRTISEVRQLKQNERDEEIMRMLAGASATDETRVWARRLLEAGKQI
ncbi:MAG: DNA repair protein RecN [Desulfotalea sp.]